MRSIASKVGSRSAPIGTPPGRRIREWYQGDIQRIDGGPSSAPIDTDVRPRWLPGGFRTTLSGLRPPVNRL